MVQQKTVSTSDIPLPAQGKKTTAYKNPALDKIHKAILELNANLHNPAHASHTMRQLCTLLLENIAIPSHTYGDSSYGSSFAFKIHLALIRQINGWLLHTAGRDSRRVKDLLNNELLSIIRQGMNDSIEKKKYILLFWMLKFPLVEHVLHRKNMKHKEDLYQGSYAILIRCVERCDPENPECFDAYYTKALLWNLPRVAWQVKSKKEIPVLDRVMSESRAGREMIPIQHEHHAPDGSEEKKDIIDNLIHEWWQKVKAGVKQITGTADLSFETLQEVFTLLKRARQESSHLCDYSRMNKLLGGRSGNPSGHGRCSSPYLEANEFVRYVTMIYIAYRMLKQGKKQAQIARELNLSRERIRQYVQTWIRPYIKTKIIKVGLATARHAISKDYQQARKKYRAAKVLMHKFFTQESLISPLPLITRINHGNSIKLFKLNLRCPKRIVMPGQMVRIAAEPYGKENRLIMNTYSHKEKIGWCLVHWDKKNERLVSSSNKTTVALIPFKLPEEKVQKQRYRHFVKALRRGFLAQPPDVKLNVKTSVKYPAITAAIFGKSNSLYLNLTDTHYVASIIGVQIHSPEKTILVKFEAVERKGHVEFKQIILSGTDQWHYRALILKKDASGKAFYYPLADRAAGPVQFDHVYDEDQSCPN